MKQFEDRLSKYIAGTLFGGYAKIELGSELLPDSFRADVLLIPEKPLPVTIPGAGLLALLTQDAWCLLEAFSTQVQELSLQGTLCKLRLVLHKSYKEKPPSSPSKAVLWIIAPYWPTKALNSILGEHDDEIEPGLRRWRGFRGETVYVVNSSELALRNETLFFCLLGKGRHRREAVLKIFEQGLEPYATLLNNFDLRFQEMTKLQTIDPEVREDLQDLHDTRMEVLLELGQEKGKELGEKAAQEKIARRLLDKGMDAKEVASITELSLDEIQALLP